MPAIGTATLSELDDALEQRRSKLKTAEVHALLLGAMTSTDLRLQPQHLLERIFGDDFDLGPTEAEAMAFLHTYFGYWNHLHEEQLAERVRLAPLELPEGATREALQEYARRRYDEIMWYIRGIDAGGDDPIEVGSEGQVLHKRLAQASAYLAAYRELLDRPDQGDAAALTVARDNLLMLIKTVEGTIAELMAVCDRVRSEALATFQANAGRRTDDGAQIARPARAGRNERCPCGSGKKWKRCCGFADPMH